jgi:uncharacterized protein (TIGR02679 family)
VSGRPVRLQDLATALADHGLTVRGLVEGLDGVQIVEDRALRTAADARRAEERRGASELLHAAGVDPADAAAWLQDAVLPRAGDGALLPVASDVAAVWRRLSDVRGTVGLAALAAELFGDAHALDHARLAGRAAARLLAVNRRMPRPTRAGREWRAAWAAFGVRCDGVSSRVLTLNLPLAGEGAAARWCAASPGEPLWLTLRSVSGVWTVATPRRVFVCENVTVLEAAADELGRGCPPMVCTDGVPSFAALDLIGRLAAQGCPVSVRADVDEAGFVVVEQVRRVAPDGELWRYDVPTYVRYVGGPSAMPPGELTGLRLAAAYAATGRALHEEELLDDLLGDLAASGTSR